jgi:kinesin family member 22
VSVRIKPNLSNEPGCLEPYQSNFIKELRPKSIVTYCFDSVFQENHDNEHIYQSSLKRTVNFFLHKRINTTILAYGQTGSGKTHTLFGSKNKTVDGLVDYMVNQMIDYITEKGISAKCSFMQIYKEKVSDLMTGNGVQLRENSNGELSLENLKVF